MNKQKLSNKKKMTSSFEKSIEYRNFIFTIPQTTEIKLQYPQTPGFVRCHLNKCIFDSCAVYMFNLKCASCGLTGILKFISTIHQVNTNRKDNLIDKINEAIQMK